MPATNRPGSARRKLTGIRLPPGQGVTTRSSCERRSDRRFDSAETSASAGSSALAVGLLRLAADPSTLAVDVPDRAALPLDVARADDDARVPLLQRGCQRLRGLGALIEESPRVRAELFVGARIRDELDVQSPFPGTRWRRSQAYERHDQIALREGDSDVSDPQRQATCRRPLHRPWLAGGTGNLVPVGRRDGHAMRITPGRPYAVRNGGRVA